MSFIWEALIIILVGYILLRLLGKKTIAQMSGLEVFTLLSIASITGHAVSEQDLWKTVLVLCIFVTAQIAMQLLTLKFNFIERILIGKAILVIQEGKPIIKNLKKLRMSVDQLEARLREKGIASFNVVQSATIEMNGELGYDLMPDEKPVTVKELQFILKKWGAPSIGTDSSSPLFEEIIKKDQDQHPTLQ